jgi:hypothetical protein
VARFTTIEWINESAITTNEAATSTNGTTTTEAVIVK